MFHGVVEKIPPYALYKGTLDCQLRSDDFERAIVYCKKHFNFIRQEQIQSYLEGTAKADGVLVSFDDALQSVYDVAFPILKQYHAPATVFVTSDWTNSGKTPAIFALEYAAYNQLPATVSIAKQGFVFEQHVSKQDELPAMLHRLWSSLLEQKKVAPLVLDDDDIKINNHTLDRYRNDTGDCWKPASWAMLEEMQRSGLIEYGAHGKTHTPFNWLSANELRFELGQNKKEIAAHLGTDVITCSYPHGLSTPVTRAVTQEYVKYAFANIPVADEPSHISRYNVPHQRPNHIPFILRYARLGGLLRRAGSLTRLY